jgi:hypothetical protein
MRDYKWQFFLVVLCLGVILTVSISPKKQPQKPKQNLNNHLSTHDIKIEPEAEPESIETIENKIYKIGYQRGQRAMLLQMEKPDLVDKSAEYTVNFEIPKDEKERLDSIMSKAYVDGYHKAGDLLYCPKNNCPY